MIYATLLAAALAATFYLVRVVKLFRQTMNEPVEQDARTYGDWPHLPRDGSRGYRK